MSECVSDCVMSEWVCKWLCECVCVWVWWVRGEAGEGRGGGRSGEILKEKPHTLIWKKYKYENIYINRYIYININLNIYIYKYFF